MKPEENTKKVLEFKLEVGKIVSFLLFQEMPNLQPSDLKEIFTPILLEYDVTELEAVTHYQKKSVFTDQMVAKCLNSVKTALALKTKMPQVRYKS